jgi:phosphoribosylformylglycinamidine cyclo-ligase
LKGFFWQKYEKSKIFLSRKKFFLYTFSTKVFSQKIMATYKDSGVDISAGDKASKRAYECAKNTFSARDGMFGAPVQLDGGFAGALDFGDFYTILNCDGVGTKIDIALDTQNFAGLGYDLLAMTADDAICVGAEVVSITNTFDTNKVNAEEIGAMMKSLEKACVEQNITISGGEIAELGNTLNKTIWNSTAMGVVEKEKFLTGEKIQAGDIVISLKEDGFRSNGFSLARYVLAQNNIKYSDLFDENTTWGEQLLTPCTIFHNAVLDCMGRFREEKKVQINGCVHVTGGGLAGNFFRILKKKGLGANLPDIYPMTAAMKKLQEIGNIEDREVYKTWNGGNGMLLVVPPSDAEKTLEILKMQGIEAKISGEITDTGKIFHANFAHFGNGEMLEWSLED